MCFAINGQKKSWVACFGLKIVAWHSNVNHFIELTLMSTSVYINIQFAFKYFLRSLSLHKGFWGVNFLL